MIDTVVEITSGKVRGYRNGPIYAFKNIPYGAPPVGERRFCRSHPPAPWPGVRDCLSWGNIAPQLPAQLQIVSRPSFAGIFMEGEAPASEDCLNLNVWTPEINDGRKRPVMVWLHGGGFTIGAAAKTITDGAALARRGDVVVASLHHRLNAFGFTDLSAVDPDPFAASGQVGMLDIVDALLWIKHNISSFGGDPANVTLFGESGGGQKICALMAMEQAKGLFHKAVIQSGPALRLVAKERGPQVAAALMKEFGLQSGETTKLQRIPQDALLSAALKVTASFPPRRIGESSHFQPVVDGRVISQHPFDERAPAEAAHVPLLIGTNRTEFTFFVGQQNEFFDLDEAGLVSAVERMIGSPSEARSIVASFRSGTPKATASELFFLIASEVTVRSQSIRIAEMKSAQQAPVYMYRFDWETPVEGGRFMSPHTIEIPFVFNNARDPFFSDLIGKNPSAYQLADCATDAWVAFARTGDPSTAKLGCWPRYTSAERDTMILDVSSRVEKDPAAAEREVVANWMFAKR